MFSIFMSCAMYPLAEKSIEVDVDEIMCDGDITSSLNPFHMLKNSIKKMWKSFVFYSFSRKRRRLEKRLVI
jgi:hypothetical protein